MAHFSPELQRGPLKSFRTQDCAVKRAGAFFQERCGRKQKALSLLRDKTSSVDEFLMNTSTARNLIFLPNENDPHGNHLPQPTSFDPSVDNNSHNLVVFVNHLLSQLHDSMGLNEILESFATLKQLFLHGITQYLQLDMANRIILQLVDLMHHNQNSDIQCDALRMIATLVVDNLGRFCPRDQQAYASSFASLAQTLMIALNQDSLQCIGEIASISIHHRDFILRLRLFDFQRCVAFQSLGASLLRSLAAAISVLVQGEPSPPLEYVTSFIPTLAHLVRHYDEDVILDSLSALYCIASISNDAVALICGAGVVSRLSELHVSQEIAIQVSALRCTTLISQTADHNIESVFDSSFLESIHFLLQSSCNGLKKDCCRVLLRTCTRSSQSAASIISNGTFLTLLYLLNDRDAEMALLVRSVVKAICDACNNGEILTVAILQNLGFFSDTLASHRSTNILQALETIGMFFHAGMVLCSPSQVASLSQSPGFLDAVQKMELLIGHPNEDIKRCTSFIMNNYIHFIIGKCTMAGF